MLIQLDGTFIFVAISFLIFLAIIKYILFHPFSKIIEEREKFIDKNLKTEQESKQKAKDLILERDRKIKSSRAEAGEIIKQTTLEAKTKSEKIIKNIKSEVEKELEENKKIIEIAEKNNATSNVKYKKNEKGEVRNFVKSIVSKILNEEVEIDIEESKIEEYLKI